MTQRPDGGVAGTTKFDVGLTIVEHKRGLWCTIEYATDLFLPETVAEWAAIPTYACSLDAALGPGSMPVLQGAAAREMANFNRDARRIYRNFMTVARG